MPFINWFLFIIFSCYYVDRCRGVSEPKSFCGIFHKEDGTTSLES